MAGEEHVEHAGYPEFENIVTLLAKRFPGTPFAQFLHQWENVIFAFLIVMILSLLAYLSSRKRALIPERLQTVVELFVSGFNDFVCGILGEKGAKYTPFIGTLFIYILFMNLFGLIPFMKSATSNLSTTAALALCVFAYVQFTAFKELGFLGYFDHLAGKPRGALALSIIFPLMMVFLELVSELLRPFTLALRLRSNILGEDILLAVLASFGLKGFFLMLFSMFLALAAGIVQAFVFSTLTTIYFALVLTHDH